MEQAIEPEKDRRFLEDPQEQKAARAQIVNNLTKKGEAKAEKKDKQEEKKDDLSHEKEEKPDDLQKKLAPQNDEVDIETVIAVLTQIKESAEESDIGKQHEKNNIDEAIEPKQAKKETLKLNKTTQNALKKEPMIRTLAEPIMENVFMLQSLITLLQEMKKEQRKKGKAKTKLGIIQFLALLFEISITKSFMES